MAWTLTVSAITRGETTMDVFGSLAFSGDYATGGDAAGSFAYGPNASGFARFLAESVVHAGQMPVSGRVDLGNGYTGQLVPSAGAGNLPAIRIWVSSSGAELAAGAYPAALTGAANDQAELRYMKGI